MDENDSTNDEPFRLHLDWPRALAMYREYGRTSALELLILDGSPIPVELRVEVADIIAGRFKRPPGRRRKTPSLSDAARAAEVRMRYQINLPLARLMRAAGASTNETPTEQALNDTADQLGITPDQVSQIIFPRARHGAK